MVVGIHYRPIDDSLIDESLDTSYGRIRTEVKFRHREHLGRIFDGPVDSGGPAIVLIPPLCVSFRWRIWKPKAMDAIFRL